MDYVFSPVICVTLYVSGVSGVRVAAGEVALSSGRVTQEGISACQRTTQRGRPGARGGRPAGHNSRELTRSPRWGPTDVASRRVLTDVTSRNYAHRYDITELNFFRLFAEV